MPKEKKTILKKASFSKTTVSESAIGVIEVGGRQEIVITGKILSVYLSPGEKKKTLNFINLLNGKKIIAEIISVYKTKKIPVVKFKSKKRVLKIGSHRQHLTKIKIKSIA